MHDLEKTVERLTSEVTSLKLELATLISAIQELQRQNGGHRPLAKAVAVKPLSHASPIPAAVVVLLAAGWLSWQVITTSQRDRIAPQSVEAASVQPVTPPAAANVAGPSAEPESTAVIEPTVYRGTLAIAADRPGAEVFVNRRLVGTAPVRVRNLRAGSHLVWVESDGYRRWTRVVTVPAERVTRVTADLEPEPAIEN